MTDPAWTATREGRSRGIVPDPLPPAEPALLCLRQRTNRCLVSLDRGGRGELRNGTGVAWDVPGAGSVARRPLPGIDGCYGAFVPVTGTARRPWRGRRFRRENPATSWCWLVNPGADGELVIAVEMRPGHEAARRSGPDPVRGWAGHHWTGNWEEQGSPTGAGPWSTRRQSRRQRSKTAHGCG